MVLPGQRSTCGFLSRSLLKDKRSSIAFDEVRSQMVRLTEEDVAVIRACSAGGVAVDELAARCGVHRKLILRHLRASPSR